MLERAGIVPDPYPMTVNFPIGNPDEIIAAATATDVEGSLAWRRKRSSTAAGRAEIATHEAKAKS
jgi:hypothetical protein